jgi:hypothetical protein
MTTPGIDEDIKKIFYLIERFKKSLDSAELVREITEVQKELLAGDSQLWTLPSECDFFTYDQQQKEWMEYLDSFWGSD